MNNSRSIALKAISFTLAFLLAPAMALATFVVDDLIYEFNPASETEVYVHGLDNQSATHITIPSTVVYMERTYRMTGIRYEATTIP